jgi:hypothetical protein
MSQIPLDDPVLDATHGPTKMLLAAEYWRAQCVALRAEVAELNLDAERYRLLRDAERGDWFWSIYEDDGNGGLQLKSGADLDAALAAKEQT